MKSLVGQRFGSLVVRNYGPVVGRQHLYVCVCDCGETITVCRVELVEGRMISCGCGRRPKTDAAVSQKSICAPEYSVWTGMKSRCKLDHSYQSRGIHVCERWATSFENFLQDMGPRPSKDHSIARINTDGDYRPSNCRWSTVAERSVNRSNTAYLEVDGQRRPLVDLAKENGISPLLVRARLRSGWTAEMALLRPVRPYERVKRKKDRLKKERENRNPFISEITDIVQNIPSLATRVRRRSW